MTRSLSTIVGRAVADRVERLLRRWPRRRPIAPALQQLLQADALRGVVLDDEDAVVGIAWTGMSAIAGQSLDPYCVTDIALHFRPERLDVRALGGQRADRDARHPAAVEERRREVGRAGSIERDRPRPACGDRARRRRARAARGARRRSAARRGSARASPASCRISPASHCGVGEIAAEARLQAGDALLADQEPELQRAEAAAERQAPVAEVLDDGVGARSAGSSDWWTSRG